MIKIENLTKKFDTFVALNNVNLHVKDNEIYGFIGHNGAGKSTTMNILCGLSKQFEGNVVVNGNDVSTISKPGDLNLGFLPENPQFYPWMSAYEYLMYIDQDKNQIKINELLHWAGLKEHAHRKIRGFSRGMKQRLGMAVALINDPPLLILDEPSSALDPQGRSEILHMMLDLKKRGKTIIFSTHILSDVERICDRVGMIAKGEILFEKSLQELLQENVKPIYEVELTRPLIQSELEQLEKLENIEKLVVTNTLIEVHLHSYDVSSSILLSWFLDHHVDIVSFNQKKNSLEALFIERGLNNA